MDKFDLLLQKYPISTPVRKTLTQDTIGTMMQVKKARFARRLLGGLFVISLCFLIGKWINNDIFYLLQLLISKFALIKSQSSLYGSALIESFPKDQLLSILLAGVLWVCWRKFETFLLHTRITTRKQTVLMKTIKMTPRLVVANTLIVITALGFASYGYAQKTEQEKLQLLRVHVNQSGRTEFKINVPANQCEINGSLQDLTNQFEIKKGANLTTDEAKNVLEAACYQREAEKFLTKTFNLSDSDYGAMAGVGKDNKKILTTVVQVITKTDNSLTVDMRNIFSRQTDVFPKTFNLTSETKVYKDEKLVSQNTLQKGDTVMVLYTYSYSGDRGSYPTSTKLDGIVLLPSALDFHWYNNDLQNSVTQIQTCKGNPQDRCSFTGGIDIFPSGGGEGNMINPKYIYNPNGEMKDIAGVITEINPTFVKIKTSSGRVFTVNFGSDPINEFNQDRSQNYNNIKIGLGDTLFINYNEFSDQHTTTLSTTQIAHVNLMLEVTNKMNPIKKY